MTHESTSPEAREPEQRVLLLSRELDWLRVAMQDTARGSILEHVSDYFPDEITSLQSTAENCKDLPIAGSIETSEYFLPQPDVFRKVLLPARKHATNDFEGVFRGIDEVPTPRLTGRAVGRLCLAIDPLVVLSDPDLAARYAAKGWIDRLRHPFGESEHQDARIYIAVDSLKLGSVEVMTGR
jgi:hypothetical protein